MVDFVKMVEKAVGKAGGKSRGRGILIGGLGES